MAWLEDDLQDEVVLDESALLVGGTTASPDQASASGNGTAPLEAGTAHLMPAGTAVITMSIKYNSK